MPFKAFLLQVYHTLNYSTMKHNRRRFCLI